MRYIIKYLFILLAIISVQTSAQVIDKINITGINVINRGTVLSYLPFEVGDFYTKQKNKTLDKALMGTGFFKTVTISGNNSNLDIVVVENPSIKEVVVKMHSNNLIEKDKIYKNLDKFKITKGKIYNKLALTKLIDQIKEVYLAGGYSNAIIDYNVAVDNDNIATIKIDINENSIAKINSMHIRGNNNFEEERLLDLFSIGEADNFFVNYFTKKDHFSKIALNAGIEKLTNFYFDNGYLDIKIDKIETLDKEGNINIIIHITEGALYRLGAVSFSSDNDINNDKIKKEALQNLLKLSYGDIFRRSQIVNDIKNITDFLTNKGYAFVQVESTTTKKNNGGQYLVNLIIDIKINKIVYVNRITIEGNTRTQDNVIRREIGILEGGIYSNDELSDAVIRIKRLGFFSNVDIKVSKVRGSNDRINLHLIVEETKTGQISIGVSHSNSTGILFNTGIKEKNIFGTGNELNAELSYSKAVKNINFYFLNPYFTVDGNSFSYGIFKKSVDGSELGSSKYIIDKMGIRVSYGVPIDKDSKLSIGLKISKTDITCSIIFASKQYEQQQCDDDYNNEVYSNIEYNINTLNNYNFPTNGDRFNLNFGLALPVADYRYYKLNAVYRKYIPIDIDLTFKFNGRIGIADGYKGRDLPFFERYYGGGSSSIRGFEFNSLGGKYSDNTSKGGKLSIFGSIAIISPLSWVQDSSSMRIAAFLDAGGIDRKVTQEGVDFRSSVGMAFVWLTPIGPLGIYAAKPLKEKDGDKVKTIDFTLGTSF